MLRFQKSEHTHLSLYEIDLSGNDLSPVGAELLAATIEEQGPSLRRLDISYNDVGGKGALAMARMLQVRSSAIVFTGGTALRLMPAMRLACCYTTLWDRKI